MGRLHRYRYHRETEKLLQLHLHLTSTAMLLTLVWVSVLLFSIQHQMLEHTSNERAWVIPKPKLYLKSAIRKESKNKMEQHQTRQLAVSESDQENQEQKKTTPQYHVVFSTSCNEQQHWESMVFFYHAYKVQQPGTVTRILSGCNPKQKQEQQDFFQNYIKPMRPHDFLLHFAPDFMSVEEMRGHPYKYMNKPFGLLHWMENGSMGMVHNQTTVEQYEDDIIILVDPDMVLLRPITHDYSDVENHLWEEKDQSLSSSRRVVRHGHPIGQKDAYLSNKWMDLNLTHIFGVKDKENVIMPKPSDGPIHWNAGPPYLATVRDMFQIARKWTEYAPRVVQVHPDMYAEMHGFIFATVQLQLHLTLVRSLLVSTTKAALDREGWPFVEALPEHQVCNPQDATKLPIILHYSQSYLYGETFFSKHSVNKNPMGCQEPLLKPPPPPPPTVSFAMDPPPTDRYEDDAAPAVPPANRHKREAFMVCGVINAINEALEHHKKRACAPGTANFDQSYTVHQQQ